MPRVQRTFILMINFYLSCLQQRLPFASHSFANGTIALVKVKLGVKRASKSWLQPIKKFVVANFWLNVPVFYALNGLSYLLLY